VKHEEIGNQKHFQKTLEKLKRVDRLFRKTMKRIMKFNIDMDVKTFAMKSMDLYLRLLSTLCEPIPKFTSTYPEFQEWREIIGSLIVMMLWVFEA